MAASAQLYLGIGPPCSSRSLCGPWTGPRAFLLFAAHVGRMILPLVCWAGFTALLQPAYGEFISTDGQRYNEGKFGHKPQHHFYSSKEVSPVLQVNTWDKSAISDDGSHIFLRHCGNTTSSPLVLDARDLSTVYVSHASGFEHVYGTRVQENFGKKYLTFWAGEKDDGFGTSSGYGLAYDDTYRLVYNVSAHVWRHSDLHEFAFTGHGTALILAVDDVLVNTADWPEWEGDDVQVWARDNIIQEVDLETNELLFSWRALDHITGADSFEKVGSYWDIFHTNSIQKVAFSHLRAHQARPNTYHHIHTPVRNMC